MHILQEVLKEYPMENSSKFIEQFSDWTAINAQGNIDPVELKLQYLFHGTDRIVYKTMHPQVLLKAAFGAQEIIIPEGFEYLYLPVFEFEFPVPLQDPNYILDGRTHGQFQPRIKTYQPYDQQYLPSRALQRFVQVKSVDVGFAKAVIAEYSLEVLVGWVESFATHPGMRGPSSQNWGYLNGKPVIFDAGRIIE